MAKDVITRFKLETTGFDSKIKEAAKELSAYSKTATQAKEGFNQFTKANVDAAKALGTMATSTTNVKDRAKELVGAYNEAAKAYEALSDEHKQSDWAKALAGSLTQLQQRIKETKAEMQGLGDSMKGADDGSLLSKLGGKMDGALAVFGGNLMTKAAGMGVGLVTEMTDAVKQGIELAKAGEGVRIAFERLGRGDILQGLREATHGTVTDLELMKAAVKFNDFKLPVEELGTMLAFAQQKAKDTGQSVDYMVDSIVTGLGRKSLMILDNLGLSAAEIKDKMKDTGDMTKAVGAIIRDQMKNAGDYVETAADRAAQANVSLQNKMEELGRKFGPVEEASNQLWTSMKIGILDIIGGPLARLLNGLTEAGRLRNELDKQNGDGSSGKQTKVQRQLSELRGSNFKDQRYNAELERYNRQIMKADELLKKYDHNRSSRKDQWPVMKETEKSFGKMYTRDELDTFKKALMTMRDEYMAGAKEIMQSVKPTIDTSGAEQNLDSLKKKLKELEAERRKAVKAGDNEMVDNLTKQINATKQNIGYLDPNAAKSGNGGKNLDDEQKVQQKINDLLKEALTADANRQGEIRQQVAELQKQQEKYKDIKNLAQGILPKDKEAVFTIDGQLSEETKKNLRDIENVTIDDKTMTVTAETQEAMQKVQELIGQVSTATLQMKVAPPDLDKLFPDMSKQNYNTGYAGSAQAKYDSARVDLALGPMNFDAINDYISGIKGMLKDANLGDELYTSMTEKLKDATTVSTLLQEMMERGLEGADLETTAQALKEKLLSPEGIDQTAIQSFLEELNKQIEEAGGVGLKLNSKTGEVTDDKDKGKDDGEELKKFNEGIGKMASGLSQVTGGLKAVGIEIPKEVDQVLGVINGVSQIISGVGTIISIFGTTAITANTTAVGLNTAAIGGLIAALEFNSFTNFFGLANGGIVPAFAHGGLIGRAAGGMMIPGNSMSGDRLRMPVDSGRGVIGVNSGELILNKSSQNSLAASLLQAESLVDSINNYRVSLGNAQQMSIASELEGGAAAAESTQPFINGEMIYLGLQAYMRRSGLGEIVTSER